MTLYIFKLINDPVGFNLDLATLRLSNIKTALKQR